MQKIRILFKHHPMTVLGFINLENAKITAAIAAGIIIWDHSAKIAGSNIRPKYVLDVVGTKCTDAFYRIGNTLAKYVAYLRYLHLDELITTIIELAQATGKIIMSPLNIIRGYMEYWINNYPYRVAITVGTLVLACVGYYAFLKYGPHIGHKVIEEL